MAFTREAQDAELGKWFHMLTDPDNGKPIELRIRRLPAAIARQMRKSKIKIRGNVTTINVPELERRQRTEALQCWTGARNLCIVALDAAVSERYSKLCPGVEFPIGQEVCIDASLTDDAKAYLLTEYPEVMAFIRAKASALQKVDDEEEEDARGN